MEWGAEQSRLSGSRASVIIAAGEMVGVRASRPMRSRARAMCVMSAKPKLQRAQAPAPGCL